MKVKKGDNVIVLTGSDKGKKGTISKVFPKTNKVVVAGINMKKKSMKARSKGGKSEIVELAMPINASNVAKQK